VDTEALSKIVDELVAALDAARDAHVDNEHEAYKEARSDILRLIPAAKAITAVIRYAPSVDEFECDESGWEFNSIHDAALRLQGILRVHARLDAALGTSGPTLTGAQFHSWVRAGADPLWRDGHQRNAIHAAAAQIENQLQAKLGREDVSGVALIREAFSLKPPEPGKPRLRFTWVTEGSEQYRSSHEGASAFGAGCFMLIRNSAAHRPTPLAEEVALEHLASLSLLARLIGTAIVVKSSAEPEHTEPERPFG
jgi:hypothetical protein